MQIRYFEPLQRAYDGMVVRLFRPFELGKWIALGFTCWLATFLESNDGGGLWFYNFDTGTRDAEAATSGLLEALPSPDGGWWAALGVAGCLVALALLLAFVLVMLWLGARGQFMFLDNVLHDRALVQQPWARYKRQGDSLFLWMLGFIVAVLVLVGSFVLAAIGLGAGLTHLDEGIGCGIVLLGLFGLLPLILAIVYVQLFTLHFVVPIMYREELTATQAWGRFLPVLRRNLGHFLLYGLFLLMLWTAVSLGLVAAGCATFCIGFVLLALPYVGTVLLLPVWVTRRLLSVEFLDQFMPELGLLNLRETAQPPIPPMPEPPPAPTV
jgi:hypothetical protein